MTCGIYKLTFEGDPRVYVGQSVNIEKRVYEHNRLLVNNQHINSKLQTHYNSTKVLPTHSILETTEPILLDTREVFWISYYNSYQRGFNMTPGGQAGGRGPEHPGSAYSKETYIRILKALVETQLSVPEIAQELKVSDSIVSNISKLCNNYWLELEDPELYSKLKLINKAGGRSSVFFKNNCKPICVFNLHTGETHEIYSLQDSSNLIKESAVALAKLVYKKQKVLSSGWCLLENKDTVKPKPAYLEIVNSEDQVFKINTSQVEFAKRMGLDSKGLSSVLLGTRKSYLGWHLPETMPRIISPEGRIFLVINKSEFAKEHGLNRQLLTRVLDGLQVHHKNWRLPTKEELEKYLLEKAQVS